MVIVVFVDGQIRSTVWTGGTDDTQEVDRQD